MSELRLVELDAKNIVEANSLTLKPGQERFLEPVSYTNAGASADPNASWQRVVMDGDRVVALVIAHFDADEPVEEFRSAIWQINVDATAQGHGVGTFIVQAVADEARARGFDVLHVLWEPGEAGPEQFFLRTGFTPTAETAYGDTVGTLQLR